jgi:hypothetical protein
MTLEWSILSPIAATNLITNPSSETAVTGHTATSTSTTVAASTLYARRGYRSIAVTPASSTGAGEYYAHGTLTSGVSYTFGVDFLGAASIPYSIYFGDTAGTLKGTATSVTGTGYWKRQTVTWACDATATYRIYMVKGASSSVAPYYLDGLQLEATAYATSYIDGDQGDGYSWVGAAHASTSTRAAWCRDGGREYYLDSDIGTRVLLMDGVGMAPLDIYSEQRSLLPGAEFQGTRAQPRSMILMLYTGSNSVSAFHSQRKDLIDLIKPDLVSPEQPFVLRYYGANTNTDAVEIRCVYSGGLEFNSPTHYRTDKVALKLTSFDPYWRELGNDAAALSSYTTGTFYYLAGRLASTGAWSTLGLTHVPTTNGTIYTIAVNPLNTDEIFFGGDFVGLGEVAGRDYIAKYTISTGTWSTVGADSGVNGAVRVLLFAADGTLYLGGAFTNVGDAAGDYFAKWTSGGGLASVAAGGTGTVYALALAPDGKIIIGGDYDNWAAIPAADNLCSWDGSAYAAISSGANDSVYALYIDRRGGSNYTLYVGGAFTTIAGTAADYVAQSSDLSTFTETAGGLTEIVSALAGSPTFGLYAGCNGAGGGVYRRDGTFWATAPITIKAVTIGAMELDADNGILYIGAGAGAVSGQLPTRTFNGSSQGELDLIYDPADSVDVTALEVVNGNIFLGMNGSYTLGYPAAVATITNPGTAASYPVIRIKRSGGTSAILKRLQNETTGAVIEFDDYAMLDGEEITLDMRQTSRAVTSSVYGSVWQAVSRASDFAGFSILPGTNKISLLVTQAGSPTMVTNIQWARSHWSIDGVAA